jgi:hypothetical protein
LCDFCDAGGVAIDQFVLDFVVRKVALLFLAQFLGASGVLVDD